MARKQRKKWLGILGGAAAIGGAAWAGGKAGVKLPSFDWARPALKDLGGKLVGGLGSVLSGERPIGDLFPNAAAAREAAEDLYRGTPYGRDRTRTEQQQTIGALLMNPLTWVVVGGGLYLLMRR